MFATFARVVRWTVIGGLVVGAAAILVFGPRPADDVPEGRVVIDYWEKWTGHEEAAMRAVVAAFNDTVGKEKGIFVRYLSTSGIEQKTIVATAAGVPPDIAGLYNQNIAQFAALGALEPLDALAAEHGITEASYKKVFWDECRYEDTLYGLVSSAYSVALFMNEDILRAREAELRAAGLDPFAAPRSIDELDRFAEALDTFDAHGNLVRAGYVPQEPGWYLQYTCLWFGGRWWDPARQKFTLTDPAVVRAYEWVQRYSRKLGPRELSTFRQGFGAFDSPQNAFLAGTVAMVQQGTFLANFIHNQKPDLDGKWKAVPFPSHDPVALPGVTYCNADVLAIPRGSRHKREAFEFIAYLHRQEVMEKFARAHCKISPLAKVSGSFLVDHPNPYVKVFDDLAASPNARGTEPLPILSEVNAEMDNFVQQLVLDQVEVRAGLEALQARLQAKYDDFMARRRERSKGAPR